MSKPPPIQPIHRSTSPTLPKISRSPDLLALHKQGTVFLNPGRMAERASMDQAFGSSSPRSIGDVRRSWGHVKKLSRDVEIQNEDADHQSSTNRDGTSPNSPEPENKALSILLNNSILPSNSKQSSSIHPDPSPTSPTRVSASVSISPHTLRQRRRGLPDLRVITSVTGLATYKNRNFPTNQAHIQQAPSYTPSRRSSTPSLNERPQPPRTQIPNPGSHKTLISRLQGAKKPGPDRKQKQSRTLRVSSDNIRKCYESNFQNMGRIRVNMMTLLRQRQERRPKYKAPRVSRKLPRSLQISEAAKDWDKLGRHMMGLTNKNRTGGAEMESIQEMESVQGEDVEDFISDLAEDLDDITRVPSQSGSASPSASASSSPSHSHPPSHPPQHPSPHHPQKPYLLPRPNPNTLSNYNYIHSILSLRANTLSPNRYPLPSWVNTEFIDSIVDEPDQMEYIALQMEEIEDGIRLEGAPDEARDLYYEQFAKDE